MKKNKIYHYFPLIGALLLVVVFGIYIVSHPKERAEAQTGGSFSFSVAGDYSSTSNTDAVLTTIKGSGVAFHLAVGDLSYDTQGSPAGWGTYVKNIIGTVPFAFVMGNHDASQVDQFVSALPNPMTNAQGSYGKQYFFDYPQTAPIARFILLDPVDGSKDLNWVNTSIDSARSGGIKWIIVGMHHPCLAVGQKSCESGQDLLTALITKKADVVLYGHDHNYQRTKQLSCAKANSFDASCVAAPGPAFQQGAGTVFATVGTGGNSFYGVSQSDSEAGYFAVMNSDTYGILKFDVSPAQLSAQFVKSAGGSLADSFTIAANSSTSPQGSASPSQPTSPGSSGSVLPSFYPLAPCPTCATQAQPTVGSGVTPQAGSGSNAPQPTAATSEPAPCDNSEIASDNAKKKKKSKKHKKSKKGSIGNIMEQLLKFLRELISKLIELLGGSPIQQPQTPEQPSQPEQPDVTDAPDSPGAPCPSSAAPSTGATVPTTAMPSSAQPSTALSAAPSAAPSGGATGDTKSVQITFYGAYDNDPKGSKEISNPGLHQEAGGTGTFADPLTFASPQGTGEYAVGSKIYVPLVQKYFIREDVCAQSWTAPNGCGDVSHVDLYVGNPSDSEAVLACEESLTPSGNGEIIVNPPANLPVDPAPIWDQSSGTCMKPH